MSSIVIAGDTSGSVTLAAPAVAGTTTLTLPATSGTVLTTASTTGISGSAISSGTVAEAYGGTGTTTGYYGFKNRIINGAMVIDQRNVGSSVTPTDGLYTLDRWQFGVSQASKLTVQQSSTAPTGFSNSLLVTSSSSYSIVSADYFYFRQYIEGFNFADFMFGTANAQTLTLSFWVRSSLTGTFGGSLINSAGNRSYPFTYTINAANTFEQKTVTVTGDTSGTWVGATNGAGISVNFGLGVGSTYSGTAGAWASALYLGATGATSVVGTNGATWYVTGVQLEKGSTATSFDVRDYGRELMLCQRYYYRMNADTTSSFFSDGQCAGTTDACGTIQLKVSMRTYPTALEQSGTATDYRVNHAGGSTTCSSVPAFRVGSSNAQGVTFTVASGLTLGRACALQAVQTTAYLAWSAEL